MSPQHLPTSCCEHRHTLVCCGVLGNTVLFVPQHSHASCCENAQACPFSRPAMVCSRRCTMPTCMHHAPAAKQCQEGLDAPVTGNPALHHWQAGQGYGLGDGLCALHSLDFSMGLHASLCMCYGMYILARWCHTCSYAAGWALCGHETPAGQAIETDSWQSEGPVQTSSTDSTVQQHQCAKTEATALRNINCNDAERLQAFHMVRQLSRDKRIHLGQKCKQLIDKGREQWLGQQGFQVCSCF